jgi:hypothetical protein
MIKFNCDTCGFETDNYKESKNNNEYIPVNWITLSNATVHNENHYQALIYAGNATMHFCSKKCFINKFFKEEID